MFSSRLRMRREYGVSSSVFYVRCRMFSGKINGKLLQGLQAIERKSTWLASYMVHNANTLREKRDGLKVGGHQASSASCSTILTTLYCHSMGPNDRIAVKPHASPIMHAVQYLLGNQTLDQLQRFRAFGGCQSYPSRTKDKTDVDFSTGSVGLGAVITTFSAYIQDWLLGKRISPQQIDTERGRTIALVGDAELDEGNVFEGLTESSKLKMENNWWIIDFNRQSLDKVAVDDSFRHIDRMFRSTGWQVITLKYGKKMMSLFAQPGGKAIQKWLIQCDNDLYCSLVFRGGRALRVEIMKAIGNEPGVKESLSKYDDEALKKVMTNLGGHCFETLIEAFEQAATSPQRTCFICYTIKGYGLPLAGHRDNHGLFMNSKQIETLQSTQGIPVGQEWSPDSGFSIEEKKAADDILTASSFYQLKKSYPERVSASGKRDYAHLARTFAIPDIFYENSDNSAISTQAGFGHVMHAISKSSADYATRILTTSPDVTTSTNLTGFLNTRGVFGNNTIDDRSKTLQVMSMNKWSVSPQGQHIELGIAENNLFLMLAAAGLSHSTYGQRILPIGTLYDPFILRGLDCLIYGCYQDARFMVVATPAGITLAPEGGAHQSTQTPLVGMSQAGLAYFEPAYVDELQVVMAWGLRYMQLPTGEGGSVYLRLSTRLLNQPVREMTTSLRDHIVHGAYFHGHAPSSSTKVCLAFVGALAPEAKQAVEKLRDECGGEHGVVLLQITSPDILYQNYLNNDSNGKSHIHTLLKDLPCDAAIVTAIDGHPNTLTWLAAIGGHRICSLGVSKFGQSGNLADLYEHYELDSEAMVRAARRALSTHRPK